MGVFWSKPTSSSNSSSNKSFYRYLLDTFFSSSNSTVSSNQLDPEASNTIHERTSSYNRQEQPAFNRSNNHSAQNKSKPKPLYISTTQQYLNANFKPANNTNRNSVTGKSEADSNPLQYGSYPPPLNNTNEIKYNDVKTDNISNNNNINDNGPYSGAKGQEISSAQQPWHPGKGKAFGFYQCKCGSRWTSGNSWADETQDCKGCGKAIIPYKQQPLEPKSTEDKVTKPHEQELCSKCQKLGHLCSMTMELSKKNPKDVYVKGLPSDITEDTLKKLFRPYGPILRVHLLKPQDTNQSRAAFITFQNPKMALERFNGADVPAYEENNSFTTQFKY